MAKIVVDCLKVVNVKADENRVVVGALYKKLAHRLFQNRAVVQAGQKVRMGLPFYVQKFFCQRLFLFKPFYN